MEYTKQKSKMLHYMTWKSASEAEITGWVIAKFQSHRKHCSRAEKTLPPAGRQANWAPCDRISAVCIIRSVIMSLQIKMHCACCLFWLRSFLLRAERAQPPVKIIWPGIYINAMWLCLMATIMKSYLDSGTFPKHIPRRL